MQRLSILLILLVIYCISGLNAQQYNQFTFLKGNTTDYSIGAYGTQGVASVSNNPGKRHIQATWEYNGKIYIFGGAGYSSQNGSPSAPEGYMNDLWEYEPSSNNWRWLKGSNLLGASPILGTQGIAAPSNTPGAKVNAATWIHNGKLYMFGGFITYIYLGRVNDLWEYDPGTNNWKWVSGQPNAINIEPVYGTKGLFDASNNPGGREGSVTWTYNGKLFLFGGMRGINGLGDVWMNDLWEYDPALNQWRWIGGSPNYNEYGTYGIKGEASEANIPGARFSYDAKQIGNKLYLYGGWGLGASGNGLLNDLWEYDMPTGLWKWLHGSSTPGAPRVLGTTGVFDAANTPGQRWSHNLAVHGNKLYFFGGKTFSGFLGDLWQYDPSINQWRFLKGNTGFDVTGNYGLLGVEASTNLTSARAVSSFIAIDNYLYMFGGRGKDGTTSSGDQNQNDLWRYNTNTNNWTWLKGASGREMYSEYGTLRVPSGSNKPGGRIASSSVGYNGKFYTFAGQGWAGFDAGNPPTELWEYDPATNFWTFLKGRTAESPNESYGTLGVPSITNIPVARWNPCLWAMDNKIYMFGGDAFGSFFNDLWMYDLATHQWTWIGGANSFNQPGVYGTKGIPANSNIPGARGLCSYFNHNGKLYLFGGFGHANSGATGYLNDLWEYNPVTNQWTWLSGTGTTNPFGVYGTINTTAPENVPGGRATAQMQAIGSKAYMFGGRGYGAAGGEQNLNDTWEYDLTTKEWKWLKGSSNGATAGVAGSFGIEHPSNLPSPRYHACGWTLNEKLYVFSGTPFGPEYNDLWEYNPATNNWRFIAGKGNQGNTPANYGLQGLGDIKNLPPIRWQSTAAVAGGSAYIFGGYGGYANKLWPNTDLFMADLWQWTPGPDDVFKYGVDGNIYVNDNSTTGDVFTTAIGNNDNPGTADAPLATLDFAVSVAGPGNTIYVDAGTYLTPNFSVNNPVIIRGANYNISPNNPTDKKIANANRISETIINGATISINSSDITFEGLTFDPGNKQALVLRNNSGTNNNFGNIRFIKNVLRINSTQGQLSFTGVYVVSPEMPLTSGLEIIDNRFEKFDAGFGQTIQLSYLKDILLTDNSFVVNGTTVQSQLVIYAGLSGIVDNLQYKRNVVDRSWYNMFAPRLASAIIEENDFDGSLWGITISNNLAENTDISILNNRFSSTLRNQWFINYQRSAGGLAGSNIIKINNNKFNYTVDNVALPVVNNGLINVQMATTVQGGQLRIEKNEININGNFSQVNSVHISGVRFGGNFKQVEISDNELSFDCINVQTLPLSPSNVMLPPNGILCQTDNIVTYGEIPNDATVHINRNKFSGFNSSVVFVDLVNGVDTYTGYGNLTTGATVNIHNNSFTGDILSINNGTNSQTVNASCNWFGTSDEAEILTKITPATVNLDGWLTNGTDAQPAVTGFQPMPGACGEEPLMVNLDNKQDVQCHGDADGSIQITIEGGMAPYTIVWSKNGQPGYSETEDLEDLGPGAYSVTATDANNNVQMLNDIIITEPPALSVSITDQSTACSNNALAIASGGTPGYSYAWSNGAIGALLTGAPAGTYTVTVSDEKGCTAMENITLAVKQSFNPTVSSTNVTCFDAVNGSITISNANGTAPFSFNINGGVFVPGTMPYTFGNLAADTYTVGVRDANGCTGFNTRTLSAPAQLIITPGNIVSACSGQSNGSISASVSGGTPGYTYSWTGPNNYSSSQLNIGNLAAGNYTLTVRDKNLCVAIWETTVPVLPSIMVTADIQHVACRGTATGAIDVTATGGSGAGFTYAWSGAVVSSSEDLNNLAASNNYKLLVTDIGSGCTVSNTYTVTQPSSNLSVSASRTNATGCATLGTITATGSGGTAPYMFSINGGVNQSSGFFSGLYAGDYLVAIEDANGCTATRTVSITDNGSDAFEGNNSKKQAKTIPVGQAIQARIATAADVADWFQFTTPAGNAAGYRVSLSHSSVSFAFDVFPAGNNTPALVPANMGSGTKEYLLNGGTTYFIMVTGGLSFVCYDLLVESISSPPLFTYAPGNQSKAIEAEPVPLTATAFPNPHRGSFTLRIESPVSGQGHIMLYDLMGRAVTYRKVLLNRGGNVVRFDGMMPVGMIYRVSVAGQAVSGKLIGIR